MGWASGSPWEPGPKGTLSFRGAGPTSEEGSPRSELSGSQDPPSPPEPPAVLAKAQAGLPPGPVCAMSWQHESGPPLALSAEDAPSEGGQAGWGARRTCTRSAWTWLRPPPPRCLAAASEPRWAGEEPHSGGPSGRHGLVFLGPVVICGFLCRIPMEPGARQRAAFWRK